MFLNTSKDIHLAVNTGKAEWIQVGRRRGMMANECITVKAFKYLGCLLTNQNSFRRK